MVLEASGIHVFYGASHVLRGVDLRVATGETVALTGRNGMGKSTLLKAVMGLVPPRAGRVAVDGADVTGSEPHAIARRGIGYVPEGRGIFPTLDVRETLVMAARPGPDGRRDWTLERVLDTFPRLAERLSHRGGHLSGGEQQMLAIGRALMTNPRLLILDEATEGLAPLVRREIWTVIRAIKATGIATVVVDKNLDVLLGLADRFVTLVKGEVVHDGPGDAEILRRHIGL
ncbi:MAG: ABC transporter ATP-binding protein [Pseudomonadota bacterium]